MLDKPSEIWTVHLLASKILLNERDSFIEKTSEYQVAMAPVFKYDIYFVEVCFNKNSMRPSYKNLSLFWMWTRLHSPQRRKQRHLPYNTCRCHMPASCAKLHSSNWKIPPSHHFVPFQFPKKSWVKYF